MFSIVGLVVVMGCVFGVFVLHGGNLEPIIHAAPSELATIGGAAVAVRSVAPVHLAQQAHKGAQFGRAESVCDVPLQLGGGGLGLLHEPAGGGQVDRDGGDAGHGGSDGAIILLGVILVVAGIVVLAAVADDHYDDEYWDDCWCY